MRISKGAGPAGEPSTAGHVMTNPPMNGEDEPDLQLENNAMETPRIDRADVARNNELKPVDYWPEVDNTTSSTPDYDTGGDAPWEIDDPNEGYSELPLSKIISEIKSNGPYLEPPPAWMMNRRFTSLQIIHDGILQEWPQDVKCNVKYIPGPVKNWIRHLRAGLIRIRGHSIVLVSRGLHNSTAAPHLKNTLSALVRAARSATRTEVRQIVRVYVTDALPSWTRKVVGPTPELFNVILHQALRGLPITHQIEKVFEVSLYHYFAREAKPSSRGSAPRPLPIQKYVRPDGVLTKLGCLHFRAHLFREIGLTRYR